MPQKINKQHILSTIAILSLILLSYQAVKMVSANVSYYRSYQLTEHWLKNNNLTDLDQFNVALESIVKANKKHPNNPKYLAAQGLVHEWAGISNIFTPEEQRHQLQLAKKLYLQAVELRPTWPTTWATLAILKWRLDEIDQELITYLHQADKYGPNTFEVHNAWLEIGFYLYKSKSTYTTQVIKGLRKHFKILAQDPQSKVKRSTLAIIKRHQMHSISCKWLANFDLDTSWYQKNLCQNK